MFWGKYRSTTLLPNVKNVLGHCHGETQNFLESKLFSTGCQMYSKNVDVIVFVHAACDKMKISHPDASVLLTPSRCHQHVWPLEVASLTEVLPRPFSTHNYIHLIQMYYISLYQQTRLFFRISNLCVNGFLRIPFEPSDISDLRRTSFSPLFHDNHFSSILFELSQD